MKEISEVSRITGFRRRSKSMAEEELHYSVFVVFVSEVDRMLIVLLLIGVVSHGRWSRIIKGEECIFLST